MCTVTYIPFKNSDFLLTSSRDVPFARKNSEEPKKHIEDGIELHYPKDGKAGGTWIGTSSKNRLICLLNGGFTYHTSRASYKKSRGLIVKDLLKVDDIYHGLETIDLKGVEPFTLTIVDWNSSLDLIEFVWDGTEKHFLNLPQQMHIWSSSTLYDQSTKLLRRGWFADWQKEKQLSQENILEFHHDAGIGDPHIDIFMDRKTVGTVSITSIRKQGKHITINYEDVRKQQTFQILAK